MEVVDQEGTAGSVGLVGGCVPVTVVAAGGVGVVEGAEGAEVVGVDGTEEPTGAPNEGGADVVFLLAGVLPDEEDRRGLRGGGKGEGVVVQTDPY